MLKGWLTFGLSPEQEDRFRSSSLAADVAQARIVIAFALVPTVAFSANDYLFLGVSRPFFLVSALRLAFIVFSLSLLRRMRRLTSYRSYDMRELTWALSMAALIILAAATRPHAFVAHAMVAALAVFAMLLVVPSPFPHQLAVAAVIIVGEALVLAPGLRGSLQAAVTVLLSMLLTGAVATAGSWQLHLLHRRGFLAREEEGKAKAEAERQLAERERAEEALRESEEKYRALFEMLPVTVVIHQDRKVVLANRAGRAMFRVADASSAIGTEITRYVGEQVREDATERLQAVGRGRPEAPDHFLTTLRRADGEEFPAEVFAADIVYQGRPATQAVGIDITERVRMQEALRDSEARLRALFAAMDDVIVVVDIEGRYLEVAPTKPDLLYRPPGEVIGKTAHEVFPAEQADYFVEQTRQALEAGRTRQIEYSLPIDGQDYCFSATIAPLSSDTAIVVARDVTALVEQRTLLLAAERARADLAEHLNEEINHRARNNLAMVSGLLQMQVLQEPNPQVAARLREAVARIRSFVDIHEKIYATGAEEANLLEVVQQVATTVRAVFATTAAELSVEGASGFLPTRAVTNLAVMTNELMTNALKHGGAGAGRAVEVKVRIDRAEGQVRIAVWNSGPPVRDGFDPATQKGMGLRLVTTFAEQYRGSFRMRPAEGGTVAELVVEEAALGQ